MKGRDIAASAAWGVTSRPGRTLSLVVALACGIACAVLVSAIVTGFSRELQRLSFGAYSRALLIRENAAILDRYGPPQLADEAYLRASQQGVTASAVWSFGQAEFYHKGQTATFAVFGVAGQYEEELDTPLVAGRFLTDEESRSYERVCLVGAEVAIEFGSLAAPGKSLRIRGVDCTIVGVLGPPRSRPSAKYAEAIITPFRTAERYFIDRPEGPGSADRITLLMREGQDMKAAEMAADLALRKRYGVPLSRPSPFDYGDPFSTLEQIATQQRMLSKLLGTLAVLCVGASLLAFGVLSTTALLARQREIALRLALGASRRHVQLQMLAENLTVGILGALLGLGGGVVLGGAAAKAWAWPFAPDVLMCAVAVLAGVAIGGVTGWAASTYVARLSPALAARG